MKFSSAGSAALDLMSLGIVPRHVHNLATLQLHYIFEVFHDCETFTCLGYINYLAIRHHDKIEMACIFDENSNEIIHHLCDGFEI
jgi:hypothetical protein